MKKAKKILPLWQRTGDIPDLFIGLVLFLDVALMRSRTMFQRGVRASEQDGIEGPHYFVCAEIVGEKSKWIPISHGNYSTEAIPQEHIGVTPSRTPPDFHADEWLRTVQRFRIEEAYSFPDLNTLIECADSAKNVSEKNHVFFIAECYLKNTIAPLNVEALARV